MAFTFRKAARTSRKIRVAVDGPSGSGKTFTMLRLAHAMKAAGLCSRIAVIDTENGGSEAYAGESPDGKPWDFEVLQLDTYNPATYAQALAAAAEAGFDCCVIDSLSHAWVGKDGALDMVDKKGGQFGAWKDVTPLHRRMVDAIIHSPMHVLCTLRTKTDYVVEQNERGKSVPRKVGLAPVQRDGLEYEFDVYGTIDLEHSIRVTKSRCSAMQDAYQPKPDPAFWAPLVKWLTSAEPARVEAKSAEPTADPLTDRAAEFIDRIAAARNCPPGDVFWRTIQHLKLPEVPALEDMEPADLQAMHDQLAKWAKGLANGTPV